MNYATVDKTTKIVVNNIEWDGDSFLDPHWKDNFDLIPWNETTKGFPVNIGYSYDEIFEGFISQKPEQNPSFVFNKDVWAWEPPIPHPNDDYSYTWDEETISWIKIANQFNSETSKTPDQLLQEVISGIST